MYLEPILSSEDIRKKMPTEKMKFDSVDKSYRSIVEQFAKDPQIWENIDGDR